MLHIVVNIMTEKLHVILQSCGLMHYGVHSLYYVLQPQKMFMHKYKQYIVYQLQNIMVSNFMKSC